MGLGLIPQFLGWLSINYALGLLPAARFSVSLPGQSVGTAIMGIIFPQEALSAAYLVGGVLVIIGIYLVYRQDSVTQWLYEFCLTVILRCARMVQYSILSV